MRITGTELQDRAFALLKTWCDELIRLQISMPGHERFDGAILCPACQVLHGRSPDAIYPMMYMADVTGEEKYLRAAKKLFDWCTNLICDDGGMYNDAEEAWKGITVFNATALCDALRKHGHLLDAETRRKWEARMADMGEWLFRYCRLGQRYNINYFGTNALAMAMLGNYFDRSDYRDAAGELARYCMRHITENGLLCGEGQPNDAVSEKGCGCIDVGGYNVEETLPSLCRYAMEAGDEEALKVFTDSYRAHLEFMLPDGAWDNSMGTRAFKWTYWGSRTSDGCQEALFELGKKDPVFAEAALRNMELFEKCTHEGLLHGGRDYYKHGERACVHHAFCHAKVLAGALDNGFFDLERTALPSDTFHGVKYYPEMDSCRVGVGDWRADITAYDFNYFTDCHASGGEMCMLWNRKVGPVIAAGQVEYQVREYHNQQLTLKSSENRCVCPRVEIVKDGARYADLYDFHADVEAAGEGDRVVVNARSELCDNTHTPMKGKCPCHITYTFTRDAVCIEGRIPKEMRGEAVYRLPVIAESADVAVVAGTLLSTEKTFNLNPGFMCVQYNIMMDENGGFAVRITA